MRILLYKAIIKSRIDYTGQGVISLFYSTIQYEFEKSQIKRNSSVLNDGLAANLSSNYTCGSLQPQFLAATFLRQFFLLLFERK